MIIVTKQYSRPDFIKAIRERRLEAFISKLVPDYLFEINGLADNQLYFFYKECQVADIKSQLDASDRSYLKECVFVNLVPVGDSNSFFSLDEVFDYSDADIFTAKLFLGR